MKKDLILELNVTRQVCRDVDTMESIYGGPLTFLQVPTSIKPSIHTVSHTQRQSERFPFLMPVDAKDSTLLDRGALVRFRRGSAELFKCYMSNYETLEAIDKALKILKADNSALLSKITIIGFVSPDGDPEFNFTLSELRANALSNEIIDMHPEIMTAQIEIISGGEDWQDLRNLVAQTEMSFRDEMLDIIDNTPESQVRKLKLQRLRGGVPYRSVLDLIYPRLRDACYIRVWFEEKPDMEARIIDQAIEEIECDLEEALDQLHTVEYDHRSWNALGICYLIKGEIGKARHYFVQALDSGNEGAKSNLLLINTKESISIEMS